MALGRRRFPWIAVLLSVCIHLVASLLVVLLPRALPNETGPQKQGTVELLMVEQKGAGPSQASQKQDTKTVPPQQAKAPNPESAKEEAPTPETEPVPAQPIAKGDESTTPEQAPSKRAKQDTKPAPDPVEAQPVPPQSREAPVFDLAGTQSESNAMVLGSNVIPAMKDDRFRNRPPAYPIEAQIHNQYGSVVVVIHVAANGLATGADVLESSGTNLLDQAAIDAVRKWHFRPAMTEGRTVSFDIPFRFVFEPN